MLDFMWFDDTHFSDYNFIETFIETFIENGSLTVSSNGDSVTLSRAHLTRVLKTGAYISKSC